MKPQPGSKGEKVSHKKESNHSTSQIVTPTLTPVIWACAALSFSWVLSYILTFYGKVKTDQSLLYTSVDPGYVTPGFSDTPILGVHYFGDLLTMLSYANTSRPYSPSLAYPSAYPPFGVIIFKPLLAVSPLAAIMLLTLVTTGLLVYAFMIMTKNWNTTHRVLYTFLILLTTKPFLLNLDRGNIQGIVIALAVLFILKLREGKENLAVFCLVLAIALKGYPIFFATILLVERKYRALLKVVVCSFGLSIISGILLEPHNFYEIPAGVLKGQSVQSANTTSGLSFAANLYRILERIGFAHPTGVNDHIFKLITVGFAIIFGILATRLVSSKMQPGNQLKDFIFLATPMFLIPVSWAYNGTILSFLIIAIVNNHNSRISEVAIRPKVNLTVASIFAALLIPFPWVWSGGSRIVVGPLEIFGPVLFALYLIYCNLLYIPKSRIIR